MDANEFLNSKGLIYTRELININDERINLIELLNEYKALSQHDVIKNEEAVCEHKETENLYCEVGWSIEGKRCKKCKQTVL